MAVFDIFFAVMSPGPGPGGSEPRKRSRKMEGKTSSCDESDVGVLNEGRTISTVAPLQKKVASSEPLPSSAPVAWSLRKAVRVRSKHKNIQTDNLQRLGAWGLKILRKDEQQGNDTVVLSRLEEALQSGEPSVRRQLIFIL